MGGWGEYVEEALLYASVINYVGGLDTTDAGTPIASTM